MSLLQASEFALNLPDGLKDRTVNILSIAEEGPSDFNIVVTRERPQAGEALDRFAERMQAALLSRLPLFQVLRREVIRVDNQPATLLDYTWQSPEGRMFQRQVILHARGPNLMLVFTGTCRDKLASRWEAMFNELLAGLRLRAP